MDEIHQQLKRYEHQLNNDREQFHSKLNSIRNDLFNSIDQLIEDLNEKRNELNEEFHYLVKENDQTCEGNELTLNKFSLFLNENEQNSTLVFKRFEDLKRNFPQRPTMLKSIPEYHFKTISIDHFIEKSNSSQSTMFDPNSSLIPLQETPFLTTTISIDSSFEKQLSSQNVENDIEPQSRLTSSCSTISKVNNMLPILLKIPYKDNQSPRLICFNEEKNSLLIYSLSSHQFEYLSMNTKQISPVKISFDEILLNLAYSNQLHQYYFTTKITNRFVFFRFNEDDKQIEIEEELKLIEINDHFVNVHLFDQTIFYLYLTSLAILIFGKYHLETSSFLPLISFQNKLYDDEEQSPFRIIDFTINSTFISFLIQLKNVNTSKIIICDQKTIDQIHSFHLIDANRPISIISTEENDKDVQLLLYINDPGAYLIHCCTYQNYLIPAQVTNYGFTSLNDGNLLIITKKDIRVLDVQHYLERTNPNFD